MDLLRGRWARKMDNEGFGETADPKIQSVHRNMLAASQLPLQTPFHGRLDFVWKKEWVPLENLESHVGFPWTFDV